MWCRNNYYSLNYAPANVLSKLGLVICGGRWGFGRGYTTSFPGGWFRYLLVLAWYIVQSAPGTGLDVGHYQSTAGVYEIMWHGRQNYAPEPGPGVGYWCALPLARAGLQIPTWHMSWHIPEVGEDREVGAIALSIDSCITGWARLVTDTVSVTTSTSLY